MADHGTEGRAPRVIFGGVEGSQRARGLRLAALPLAVVTTALLTIANLEAFNFVEAGLVGLGTLAVVAAGLLGIGLGLSRGRRRPRRIGSALLLSVMASFVLGGVIARAQRSESLARGDEIADALMAFATVQGELPVDLTALVPAYLDDIPATRMGLFREVPYSYARLAPDSYRLVFASGFFSHCQRGVDMPWRRGH